MDCEAAKQEMMDAVDQTISSERLTALTVHMQSCAACKAEYELLHEGYGALMRALPKLAPPRTTEDASEGVKVPREKPVALVRQSLLAASLFVVATTFLLTQTVFKSSDAEQQAPVADRSEGAGPTQTRFVPVYIAADGQGSARRYSLIVPADVQVAPAEMDRLRYDAMRLIQWTSDQRQPETLGPVPEFRKYPVPIVPVRNE